MARKLQRLGANSSQNVVALMASATDKIPLPEGVIMRGEDEMVIWDQFTRARIGEDWRDFDLILVAKVVRLEADIRKYQKAVDEMGPIVKNDRGTQIVNPYITLIDSHQRQQLAIIRSLSLNQTASDPRVMNAQGAKQDKLRKTIDSFDDLIAR